MIIDKNRLLDGVGAATVSGGSGGGGCPKNVSVLLSYILFYLVFFDKLFYLVDKAWLTLSIACKYQNLLNSIRKDIPNFPKKEVILWLFCYSLILNMTTFYCCNPNSNYTSRCVYSLMIRIQWETSNLLISDRISSAFGFFFPCELLLYNQFSSLYHYSGFNGYYLFFLLRLIYFEFWLIVLTIFYCFPIW